MKALCLEITMAAIYHNGEEKTCYKGWRITLAENSLGATKYQDQGSLVPVEGLRA